MKDFAVAYPIHSSILSYKQPLILFEVTIPLSIERYVPCFRVARGDNMT